MARVTKTEFKQLYNKLPVHYHSFWCIDLYKSLGLFSIGGLIITFICIGAVFCCCQIRMRDIKDAHRNFFKAWWIFNMLFSVAASTLLLLVWTKVIRSPEKQNKCLIVYFWIYFAMIFAHLLFFIGILIECTCHCGCTIGMHFALYFSGVVGIIYAMVIVNSYRRIHLEHDLVKSEPQK